MHLDLDLFTPSTLDPRNEQSLGMEDPELAAIRAARMNQLQQQGAPSTNTGAGSEEAAAQRAADDEMRRNLLATVLDPPARERRMSIAVVLD